MKKLTKFLIYAFVGVLLCLNVYQCHRGKQAPILGIYTDTLTVFDTILIEKPVPRDSIVIRYVTETLPAVPKTPESVPDETENPQKMPAIVPNKGTTDSVTVQIPITQKRYETDLYRAYVSGYRPNLDSLFIYPQRQIVRIRDKPKRWGVGIQAGYGFSSSGCQPYIGVGISYNFLTF